MEKRSAVTEVPSIPSNVDGFYEPDEKRTGMVRELESAVVFVSDI